MQQEHRNMGPRIMTRVSAPTKPLQTPKPTLAGVGDVEAPELNAASPRSRAQACEELEMPLELQSLDLIQVTKPRPRPVSVQGKLTRALEDIRVLISEHLCGAGDETLALVEGIELELRAARGLIG